MPAHRHQNRRRTTLYDLVRLARGFARRQLGDGVVAVISSALAGATQLIAATTAVLCAG